MQIGLSGISACTGCYVQRRIWRRFGWYGCRRRGKRRFMYVGLQMKNALLLACPDCGQSYRALYFHSQSTCPSCRAKVQTDVKTVSFVETLIGAPILWMAATLLRTYLNDQTGLLSYALLILPALAIHLFVVRRFVTSKTIDF